MYKIIAYCILVWVIQTRLDPLAFIIQFGSFSPIVAYFIIGIVCRFGYEVVKKIVWLLTLPFVWLSFGLLWLIINIVLVYLIQYIINQSWIGLTITSASIAQVLWFAWVMTVYSMILNIID